MTNNNANMGKEDRKEFILALLADAAIPLPPAVIFRASKYRGAHFERRSLTRYLKELAEEGKIKKLDQAALDNGNIVEVDFSANGYWIVTEAGERALN